ncbi:DUF3298 domain-containing protein [Mucilaginibacter litoreus]|uniref:DUF3298 domain-containing protein n=1 Tax=Mucilaginibacter litoreus TaxID=1048221 RepID=A0ABW3AT68_9SPHI
MKENLTPFILLIALTVSSCNWGSTPKKDPHKIFNDTLAYKVQTVHERAADCGDKPDSTCTAVNIKYPVFEDQAALNDTIVKKLTGMFIMDDSKPDTSIYAQAKKFIRSYEDFKKTDRSSAMYYTLDTYAKVITQDSALVTLEYGGYIFQGGAHGASFTGFINWNPKAKKPYLLKDILKEGSYTGLTKIAERIFRHNEKLADTSSLARDYFFKDNQFALNNNYSITPTGLRFVYNQYEIKPYAAGKTELLVPYSEIKNLLRPESITAQFVK